MNLRPSNALVSAALALSIAVTFGACGGSKKKAEDRPKLTGKPTSQYDAGQDRSRCEYAGQPDREVAESTGPGAIVPNIRRVYAILGEGEDARKVIICREVDTNLDGAKDVLRTYDDKGEALREEADADYDGKIDTWVSFASGRIAKVETDSNKDGYPDEFRFYVAGRLTRLQRDTNFNGVSGGGACKGVDVWEIYRDGKLERMGVDLDHDCQVDRWDRDEAVMRARQQEEEEEESEDGGVEDGGVTDAYVSPRNR